VVGVTVRCPWNAQNGDGIDLMQSTDVLIADCTVDVGDDGICLKAGAGAGALKDGPTARVLVRGNTVFHAHGGFVVGSEFSGGLEDVEVCDNVFSGTDTGLRFKSAPERGGVTKNIVISDIYMTDIKDEAIVFQTDYADRPAGYDTNQPAQSERFVPEFQDIRMSRIVCRGCQTAIRASGTLRTVHDISIEDATFFYNETERAVDDPAMISLKDVRFVTFP
jgi:polygalacturonase